MNIYQEKSLEERINKFKTVVNIRWLILTGALITVFLFYLIMPLSMFKSCLVFILAGFLVNSFYWLILKLNLKNEYLLGGINFFSSILDAVFLGLFLFFNNLFSQVSGLIFALLIIIGGMVFTLKTSIFLVLLISLIYYGFIFLAWQKGAILSYSLVEALETIFYFVITVYFTGYLSDLTRSRSHLLWQAQAEILEKNQQICQAQQEQIKVEQTSSVTEMCLTLDEEINGPTTVILGVIDYLKNICAQKKSVPAKEIMNALQLIIDQVEKIKQTLKNIDQIVQDHDVPASE